MRRRRRRRFRGRRIVRPRDAGDGLVAFLVVPAVYDAVAAARARRFTSGELG
jgi:hypothetical protein